MEKVTMMVTHVSRSQKSNPCDRQYKFNYSVHQCIYIFEVGVYECYIFTNIPSLSLYQPTKGADNAPNHGS